MCNVHKSWCLKPHSPDRETDLEGSAGDLPLPPSSLLLREECVSCSLPKGLHLCSSGSSIKCVQWALVGDGAVPTMWLLGDTSEADVWHLGFILARGPKEVTSVSWASVSSLCKMCSWASGKCSSDTRCECALFSVHLQTSLSLTSHHFWRPRLWDLAWLGLYAGLAHSVTSAL
jgi:hypothetical protein